MEALHAILKGRFGSNAADHWVSVTITNGGVKLIALAYTWIQKGVSYFMSTFHSTHPSSVMYESYFEDEFGNISSKFLPRSQISHFLCEYLPIVDDHNTQRKSVLGLEHKFQTQCCWKHLIVTLTGMCVVDIHHLYRSEKRPRNKQGAL
jgi:hypothetical protein